MGNYKNKYRPSSARAQWWDYSWAASYFITICTKEREHFFGEISNGKMQLSHVGVIADICWNEIKNHAKNIELGKYVIMPNHVHGILILKGNDMLGNSGPKDIDPVDPVETRHALSLRDLPNQQNQDLTKKSIGQQRFQNQGKNTISSIVGGYKSAVTKHCNRLEFGFAWQSKFHDHIIRDEAEFHKISIYIENNPANWKDDKFYD
ncbi:MAG: transposase [Chitinophagales bacterium]